MDLAATFEEAGDLLRQLHLQAEETNDSGVAPMALTEVACPHRTYPSLTELRAARDLGLVRELAEQMNRRHHPLAVTNPDAQQWAACWKPSGRFSGAPVAGSGHSADIRTVKGWAARPGVVMDTLSQWTIQPGPALARW